MDNDSTFFDKVGTSVNQQRRSKLKTEDQADTANNAGSVPRWAHTDDNFWPASETCSRLDPGFYRFDQLPNIGVCLRKSRISIDDLIRLPDSAAESVLVEFSTFWGLQERFTERGFLHKRGILLWGPAGCLGADTMIHYQAFKDGKRTSKKDVTIERLYQLFHRETGTGKGRYQTLAPGAEIRISSVDDEGRIFSNRVIDVIKSGIKPVYRMVTVSGLEIIATKDHKFLSNGRYVALESLFPGQNVEAHLNTLGYSADNERSSPQRKMCYVKHHPVAPSKTIDDRYHYKVLPKSRAVVEAAMNKLCLSDYISRLNDGELEGLEFLQADHDVHHIDEDCTNDNFDNLCVYTHADHARLHGIGKSSYFVTTTEQIETIELIGDQETYDIQMEGPYNNFVADYFVVHNSGKTASLMLMAQDIVQHHDGIIVQVEHPGLAAIGLGYIRRIEPNRPIIALLEDLDALVDRHGENPYLSLLDGETQVDRIVYVATTNYPERLDKRFVDRPSRFDTIRWIGMPGAAARRMYLRTKETSLRGDELEYWVKSTDGFSVAHLRELVILVKCFDRPLDEAIHRLESMRLRQPASNDTPDKPVFGIIGTRMSPRDDAPASSQKGWSVKWTD